jgi:phage-related protein
MDSAAKAEVLAFGDNYKQRVGDGVNSMPRAWQLVFSGLSAARADEIEAFLEAHNEGQAFDWTPPLGAAGRFVCESWSRGYSGYDSFIINAQFEEDYAP